MANQAGIVKSPFTIGKTSTGSTWLSADLASTSTWQTILSYAVPLGLAIEVLPTNYHFGTYKATDTTTTITAGYTKILKQNANASESREIWMGANGIFKDIGDAFQRPHINVPVTVNASQVIAIQVYSLGTTLDSIASDFVIEAMQYYEEI